MRKRKFLQGAFIVMFLLGLVLIFGAAGYSDWAAEEGVYDPWWNMAAKGSVGILLMIPFFVFCSMGGLEDGSNGNDEQP